MPGGELSKDLILRLLYDFSQAQAARKKDADDAKAHEKEVFTAAEVQEKAKVQLVKETNRERISAAVEAAKAEQDGFKRTGDAVSGAAGQVMAFGGQMLGLASAGAVMSQIVGAFEKARQSAIDATKMVTDYRAALLELAALKGHPGDTTTETKESVAFRGATLQDQTAAAAYQMRALPGLGGAKAQGFLSDDEADRLLKMGGMYQGIEKGDAAAHGSMVGLIPQLIGRKTSANEAFGMEAQLKKIFDAGGFTFAEGAGQFSGLAELATSGTYNPMEMASLLSGFSATKIPGTGGSAQDRLKQFTTATLGGIDYTRAGSVEEGQARGSYYKSLGMTDEWVKNQAPDQLALAIGNRVAEDLGKVKDRGENPMVYLQHHGYGNQQDRESMLQYATLKNSGRLDKEFMPLAHGDTGAAGDELMANIIRGQQSDPALIANRARINEQFANIAVGGGSKEDLAAVRQGAFSRLRAGGQMAAYSSYNDLQQAGIMNGDMTALFSRSSVENEATKGLVDQAEKLGIKMPGSYYSARSTGNAIPEAELQKLAGQVKAAGGDILPGMGDVQRSAQQSLNGTTQGPGLSHEEVTKRLDTLIDLSCQQLAEPAPAAPAPAMPWRPAASPAGRP